MRRHGIKPAAAAALLSVTLLLGGCSVFTRDRTPKASGYAPYTVSSVQAMEDKVFYVMHEENGNATYSRLYADQANFDTAGSGSGSRRTLWFTSDFASVPTLYDGDRIVFRSDTAFTEEFRFERFEYVGPTIGISGISRLGSGRYYINTSQNRMGSGEIAVRSDAYKLYNLNADVAVIGTIGGAEITSGNISRAGILTGLNPGETYTSEFYVGTNRHTFALKADVIALTSMESFTTSAYDYLDGKVAEVIIPASVKTGYYSINGQGLFRLVRGTAYNEDTDFNVPNNVRDEVSSSAQVGTPSAKTPEGNADYAEETIAVEVDGPYTVFFEYGDPELDSYDRDMEGPAPAVELVTDEGVTALSETGTKGLLSADVKLKAGKYVLRISGLDGRVYSFLTMPREEGAGTGENGAPAAESAAEVPEG